MSWVFESNDGRWRNSWNPSSVGILGVRISLSVVWKEWQHHKVENLCLEYDAGLKCNNQCTLTNETKLMTLNFLGPKEEVAQQKVVTPVSLRKTHCFYWCCLVALRKTQTDSVTSPSEKDCLARISGTWKGFPNNVGVIHNFQTRSQILSVICGSPLSVSEEFKICL